jgi:hypothetical protein
LTSNAEVASVLGGWVLFAILDPDSDPAIQINADPCRSGSKSETETMVKSSDPERLLRIRRKSGFTELFPFLHRLRPHLKGPSGGLAKQTLEQLFLGDCT